MKRTKRSYRQQILDRATREGVAPEILQALAQEMRLTWEQVLDDDTFEILLKHYQHRDVAGNTNLGDDELPTQAEVEAARQVLLTQMPLFNVSLGLHRLVIPLAIRTGAVC